MPYGMYNPFGVPFYGPYGAPPLPPNDEVIRVRVRVRVRARARVTVRVKSEE